jgi:hypothetical protein
MDHYAEAQELAAQAGQQYARSLKGDQPDRMEAVQRASALAQMSQARALLAWAALLGADADPIPDPGRTPERDIYDAAVRAPVLRLPTRNDKTAAAADAPATTATTPTT